MGIKELFSKFLNLFYPRKCCICKNNLVDLEKICETCKKDFIPDFFLTELKVEYTVVNCVSCFRYENAPRTAICNLKFHGDMQFYDAFVDGMFKSLQNFFNKTTCNENFDFITCVPVSSTQLKSRGFNQSEIIAKKLSKKLNIKFENLLIKKTDYRPQRSLNYRERITNVIGAFDVNHSFDFLNKNIILCDDIITTGSTLRECCKTLLKNGAKNILCLTACKTFFEKN